MSLLIPGCVGIYSYKSPNKIHNTHRIRVFGKRTGEEMQGELQAAGEYEMDMANNDQVPHGVPMVTTEAWRCV